MLTIWEATRWTGFNAGSPIENPVSATGTGSPAHVPATTRSDNAGVEFPVVAASGIAHAGTTSAAATWPAGFTAMINQGSALAPILGTRNLTSARESAPGAAGAGPSVDVTYNRAPTDWLVINRVIRPAVPGTAPAAAQQKNGSSTSTTVTAAYTSVVAGHLLIVDLFVDDLTAVITPPAGWTAGARYEFNGGMVQRFHRIAGDSTTTNFDFAIATNTPPANTAAPHLTGTASVGSTLVCSTGTWDNSPTIYTYQWRADGVDIAGATSSTYVLASSDAGKTFTCAVTATNGGGSTTAVSDNSIAIANVPGLVTQPQITPAGPYHTNDIIHCDGGAWSGSPALTFQWFRGSSAISGATDDTYTLQQTEEGANVFCRVTATNGGGQATADSNTIIPQVTAALSDASGLYYYSGGTANSDPALSTGGARGATIADNVVGNILPTIPGSVAHAGGDYYVGVYVRNTHTVTTDPATRVYVEHQPLDTDGNPVTGLTVEVGVPNEAAGVNLPTLASSTTPPTGVAFSAPANFAAGLAFGDLAPLAQRGLWLHIHVAAGTPTEALGAFFSVVVESDTA